MSYEQGFEIMAEFMFAGYLLWVSWQDCREMQVVRYSHGLGLLAVIILVFSKGGTVLTYLPEYLAGVGILMGVQAAAYKCRLYGLADVLVLFMCGLFLLFLKGPENYLLSYSVLFAVSIVLLILVQLWKKNLHGLQLRKTVAYIPYICTAFILTNAVV